MLNLGMEKLILPLGIGAVTFLVYALTFGMYWWRQRMKLSIVFLRGLFIAAVVGTMYYQVSSIQAGSFSFQVFSDLRRISELGYKAIWTRMAKIGGPMMLVGFLLPLGFWKANKISIVALVSLVLTLLYSAIGLVLGGLDIDNAIYIFAGIIVGYALIAFIAGLVPKLKYFAGIGFKNNQYITGCVILMLTFFFGIAIFLMDNAVKILPLQFAMSDPLDKENMVMSASLSDKKEKMIVYEFAKPDLEKDSVRIANILGINGEPAMESEHRSFAKITDGTKTLELNSAGNWTYNDTETAAIAGELSPDEDVDRIARQIANNGAIRGYEIYAVDIIPLEEGDTTRTVYVYPQIDGAQIISACELKIILGANGRPISIQKFDSELEDFKKKKIISSSEAYEIVVNGGLDSKGKTWPMYHNLYSEATNINITDVNIAYWMEGTVGQLHPIWNLDAMATLVDGSTANFNIYVAAIDY